MTFAQTMASNADKYVEWDAETLFSERGPDTLVRYHVPTNGALNLDWTRVDFNDAKSVSYTHLTLPTTPYV